MDDRDLDCGLELAAQLDELQEDEIQRRGGIRPFYKGNTAENTANARKIAACRIISACRCAGSMQCTCSACKGREDGADGGREEREWRAADLRRR